MNDHAGGAWCEVLPGEQRERIHRLGLRILEEAGVKVDDAAVQETLRKAGARMGEGAGRFRLPAGLIADALASAPKTAPIANRLGEVVEVSAGGPSTFWSGAALRRVDGREGRAERIDSAWLARFTRLVSRLPNTTAVVGTALCDIPPRCNDFAGFRVMARHTRKHLRPLMFSEHGGSAIVEMGRVLAGGTALKDHPLFSVGYSVLTPLHWEATALALFRLTAGDGIPVMINSEPMAGASAPVTLAGAVALGHAEILSGIAINQLLEPGRPCIYNLGFAHVMDMRSALALTGAAENGLLGAAGAEMAAFLKLPSASWMCTDALTADHQAAYEKTLTAWAHAAAGVNVIWGIGQLESEASLSLLQAVVDDEIAGAVLRFKRGIPVNDEHLAADPILRRAAGGSYLHEEHTVNHFRTEIRPSTLSFRNRREAWERDGRHDAYTRAEARVKTLLAEEDEPCVTTEQDREMERIERRFRERLG
ncbi:MAG: trimethylamine methyltransferase family protein [Planctomycetota bacterium]|nr:trimethylamine methyltransferase family protein [Planctomycetota bacterium]